MRRKYSTSASTVLVHAVLVGALGHLWLLTWMISAKAFEGHHSHGHEELHAWYQTLRDYKGMSCCNENDCRPTSFRVIDGKAEIALDGEWVEVDEKKVLKDVIAPDHGSHVCAPKQPNAYYPKGYHYCVIIGTGT
jgi:hypothetical protein